MGPFKRINGVTSLAEDLGLENINNIGNVVVVDRMLFANLRFILYESPVEFYTPYRKNSKFGHHFQKTNPLPYDFKKNFILIGHESEINYLKNEYKIKLINKKKYNFLNEELSIYEVSF